MANNGTDRWAARPVLGALLRCAVVVVPFAVSLLVAIGLTRALPAPETWPARVGWWVAVLGGSTLALVLADRAAKRTLPLAVLLDLSLVFPGKAPSRLRASRTTSVRQLETRLVAMRAEGAAGRPIEAAETLVTLVGILGLHDRRTRGHSERVRAFTDMLTEELGLDEDARVRVRWAALVHDIGKLTVAGSVLNGGTDLTDDDWAALRRHPDEGRRLAAGLLPWLGEWGRAISEHHERWDGSGYPLGLAGEGIGYGARIVTVADAFETMTATRSYSKARSAAAAREELTRSAGSHFDPQVVRAFLSLSTGRLAWILGPVTWLAQLPFVVAADRAGRSVKAGVATAAIAGLVLVGALPGPNAARHEPLLAEAVAGPVQRPPAAVAQAPVVQPLALPFVAPVAAAGSKPARLRGATAAAASVPVRVRPVAPPARVAPARPALAPPAPAPPAPAPPAPPAPAPPAPPAPAPPAPAPPAPPAPAPPAPAPPAPPAPAPPAPAPPAPPAPAPPAPAPPAPPAVVPVVPVPVGPPVPDGAGNNGNGAGNNGNGTGSNGNGAGNNGNGAGNNGNGTGSNGNGAGNNGNGAGTNGNGVGSAGVKHGQGNGP